MNIVISMFEISLLGQMAKYSLAFPKSSSQVTFNHRIKDIYDPCKYYRRNHRAMSVWVSLTKLQAMNIWLDNRLTMCMQIEKIYQGALNWVKLPQRIRLNTPPFVAEKIHCVKIRPVLHHCYSIYPRQIVFRKDRSRSKTEP